MIESGYSYWEKELYDITYDLIVVGGGLTGQSTAYFFKKNNPKAKVLVVDRGFFPIGASTRNAGFACIGTIGEHIADLEIDSESRLRARIKNRYQGLQLLRGTLGDDAINYEHTGGWEIFTEEAEFTKARDQIGKFNAWMKELIGIESFYKAASYQGKPAISIPSEGMLHPGKMIGKLYELNRSVGVEFRWNTPVLSIDPDQATLQCENDVQLKAYQLVIATNAFTRRLLPDKVIKPGRGFVFVTKPMDEIKWKGTFHFNKGYVYFRNLGEDRILLGGGRNVDQQTEETDQFGINPYIKEYLVNFGNEVMELPQGWEIEQEWSGIMGFTESKTPTLEKAGKNTLVVAGLSGMGVALGMQLGKTAAESVS